MTFDQTFDRVIGYEGGYTEGVGDPGGETNWGISKRSYPDVDIKDLTREGAKEIYRRDFWEPLEGDALPGALMFQVFDFAVNSGAQTAIRYLQRAIGVADDGHFGPVSKARVKSMSEADVVMRLNAERLDFMTRLSNWPVASRGWARRISRNLRYGSDDT